MMYTSVSLPRISLNIYIFYSNQIETFPGGSEEAAGRSKEDRAKL